jgi:glycosyltransferase involved in cell wall biosynthesis
VDHSPSSQLTPSETVGVVVATFGDWEKWHAIGQRAVASIKAQTRPPDFFVWPHGETLAEARNFGAAELRTDWLIFLDADDELDHGYVESMLAAEGDIRRPATLGVYENGTQDAEPVMIPRRDIDTANYIVIGAMCRREMFLAAGGFPELPILEDWALWRAMVKAGATVVDVPDAIYRVSVRSDSRNQDHGLHSAIYRQIRATNPM